MRIKVSKVFAKAVNEIAEKYGKQFHAHVRSRQLRQHENWCDADFNWDTNEVRELVVSYPSDYYACEQVFSTDEILAEYNRRNVRTWEQFEKMIIDLFEI